MTSRGTQQTDRAVPSRRSIVFRVSLAALVAVALMTGRGGADEPSRPAAKDPIAEAAANYLLKAYPPGRGALMHRPACDPDAPVRMLELNALESCFPDMRFVATSLRPIYHFGEMPVVVAVERGPDGQWRGRADCLPLLYKEPSRAFLNVFRGARAGPGTRLGDVGAAIARLFMAVTHNGRIGAMSFEGDEFRYELRWGEPREEVVASLGADGKVNVGTRQVQDVGRVLAVAFDADRRITELRLIDPRALRPAGPPRASRKKDGPGTDEPGRREEVEAVSAATADYLRKTFPPDGGPMEGPVYNPEAPLRGLELKALRACFPEVRFMLTRLESPRGSPEVVVAVIREPGGEWRGRAACLSLVDEEPRREFLDLFRRVKADPAGRPGILAADIARLLGATLPDGRLGPMSFEGAECRQDLYTGERYWRTAVVAFDANWRVTAVQLIDARRPANAGGRHPVEAARPAATR